MFDFSSLPIAPENARAARNYLGMSQAKAADESGLPAHKIKRFEAGNYIPDVEFLRDLRSFFEGLGYQFPDTVKPGTRAKETGLVFPAAVVGETAENQGSPRGNRLKQASFHHMRIALTDDAEMGRVLDLIDDNEERAEELLRQPIETALFGGLNEASQAKHAEALKLLAENGGLFARLFGRMVGGAPKPGVLDGTTKPEKQADLLHQRQADTHLAASGDREAQQRRQQARKPATTLLSAIFG